MSKINYDHLRLWMEDYYRRELKDARIGKTKIKFVKSLRGYYKVAVSLDDVQINNFAPTDYVLWSVLVKNLKRSVDPVVSGGCFFRYKDYRDYCGETAFYKSRNNFVSLGLLIETPFKAYYVVNPKYVIKIFVKQDEEDDSI
jgi:hypothetical protein